MTAGQFAEAIAHAEGFYAEGDTVPKQANNPCDLEIGDIGFGAIGGKTRFASLADGWYAAVKQASGMLSGLSKIYTPEMTLAQAGLKYSGEDPNWSKNVAAALGVSETATLAQIAAS